MFTSKLNVSTLRGAPFSDRMRWWLINSRQLTRAELVLIPLLLSDRTSRMCPGCQLKESVAKVTYCSVMRQLVSHGTPPSPTALLLARCEIWHGPTQAWSKPNYKVGWWILASSSGDLLLKTFSALINARLNKAHILTGEVGSLTGALVTNRGRWHATRRTEWRFARSGGEMLPIGLIAYSK